MNVHKLTTGADDPFLYLLYDGLARTALEDRRVIPQMAESWDISGEGDQITFHLRKGIKFHDGTDFNAQVAKWHFDQLASSQEIVGSQELRMLQPDDEDGNIVGPSRVQAPDTYTLQLNLRETFAPFMSLLALREGLMMSQQAVTEAGERL